MLIREVCKSDYDAIYILVKEAFLTAQVSNGDEQDFVCRLRKRDTYIPSLELVVEHEEELVAHIMLTKQVIHGKKQESYGLLVAPLCVKKSFRNQGIGKALMEEAIKRAIEQGYMSLFLVGNPDYYERFGFYPTVFYGIENHSEIPDKFVMACELEEGILHTIGGYVILD